MTWFHVGFAFGLGAIAAMMVACITVIIIGAIRCTMEERRQLKAMADNIRGWEGTD